MDRSPTERSSLREWTRNLPERRVAGVCAGLAAQLDLPVTLIRAGFIVVSLLPGLHALGPISYLVLWFLMPTSPGEDSGLDRVTELVESLTSGRQHDADPQRDRFDG